MKKLKLVLLLALLSTATFAQKVALLVETASGHPINSDMDITTMKSLLRSDFKVEVISHQQATSKNIRQALIKIAKELKSSDTFLFYYSGHGDRFSNKISKEDDNQDDFLVTKDMTCKYNKINNVIIDDELNYRYAQIKARKIIIIDACHSETLYKSVAKSKASKRFKSSSLLKSYETCNNTDGLTRDFSIDSKYKKAKTSNMIHLAASLEWQQAEGSHEGGIFTLALQKALKEKGNISFEKLIEEIKNNIKPIATRLGADGLFTPNLNEEGINKRTLYTKDIFVIPKRTVEDSTLESYLNSHLGGIDFKIHEDEKSFVYEQRVRLKAKVSTTYNHIYLIEMLDKNHYKLLNSKSIDECYSLKNSSQKQCQYQNFKAIAPFGKSKLYMISTQKALNFGSLSKDSIISEEHFDAPASLKEQLVQQAFSVGRVTFNVMP
jgi:hypothetical protein